MEIDQMPRVIVAPLPVIPSTLASAMTRKTYLVQDGKRWTAKGTPAQNPALLLEIVARYPGAIILNALPLAKAVELYNASRPAC